MYRVVEINFRPSSAAQWRAHGSCRAEAANLWARLVRLHAWIRRRNKLWPNLSRLARWGKGKFPGLHSQSVQQTIIEFLEAVDSTRQKRAAGDTEARYPWKTRRYRPVTFTNQAPRIRDGRIILPCGMIDGRRTYLHVPLPKGFVLAGKLAEARLEFGKLALVIEVPDEPAGEPGPVAAADLGVNTLIAAIDGETAVAVSGREVKALIQWRNKSLAKIQARQSQLHKQSRRWRRLQRRKKQMLARTRRQVRDIAHKATRIVANAFPGSAIIVGQPFNDAAQKAHRKTAQTVSQAINGLMIRYLSYKLRGATVIEEHYTSQTCPVCGERQKCRRIYSCKSCGLVLPRDVVGAINIRSKGLTGEIQKLPPDELPKTIKYLRPLKRRSSSAGSAACRSERVALAA